MLRATVLLALLPSSAFAATLTVGPNSTYTTINNALNNASNGDTIELEAGVYNENLFIDFDVTIVSPTGSAGTSIGANGPQVLEVDNATLHLEGVTLAPSAARALIAYGNANVTALDIVISGFDSSALGFNSDGGAIDISDTTFTCTSCVLCNNTTNDDGGFINAITSDVTLDSVDLIGNSSNDIGGAIRMIDGTLTINSSWVANNRADGGGNTVSGGAMHLDGVVANLNDTTFDDNYTIADGAAVRGIGGSQVNVDNCTFSRNTADNGYGDDRGGAIDLLDSTANVLGSIFTDNRAIERGGAIYADDFSTVIVMDSTFRGNNANEDGGALGSAASSDVTVINSTFSDNFVSNGTGGAIDMDGDGALVVELSTFERNTAGLGGAIYSRDDTTVLSSTFLDNTANTNGGAIRWFWQDGDSPVMWVEDSLFSGNDAGDNGGAIAAWQTDAVGLGVVEIYDNQFSGNIAGSSGGALWSDGHLAVQVQRNQFCANTAGIDGGGVYLEGSGFQVNNWTNNVWTENSAAVLGGAMAMVGSGYATIVNNDFLTNDAVSGGGAYLSGQDYDFRNNIVSWTGGGDGLQADTTNGTRDFNLWEGNTAADAGGSLGAGDLGSSAVYADPTLEDYTSDGVCFNDIYNLLPGSPAIDAGDPTLTDIDGSPSDIGAYGGPSAPPELLEDLDGDGYDGVADCDDNNPAVNPGEPEVCDGADNNCDGLIDDASAPGAVDWWLDSDGDGAGDAATFVTACYAPPGYVGNDTDCDDSNPNLSPYAVEVCDGLDNNCDTVVDEGFTPTGWYFDRDGDTYGDDATVVYLCDAPLGTIATGGDCDDNDPYVNPDAAEVCDAVDNNCDGQVDEGFSPTDWFPDNDGDGYGDDALVQTLCTAPYGWTDAGGDCADNVPDVNPGATEVCDVIDNNCDGQVDEGLTTTWYTDVDGDGFGDIDSAEDWCDQPSPNAIDVGGDCDDGDGEINPAAVEVCDEVDNDCDGEVDEDLFGTWYRDADGDGFGTDQDSLEACGQPQGYVPEDGDCDDTNAGVYPGAVDEFVDQIDQDCDGTDGLPFADETLKAMADCGCSNTGGSPGLAWVSLLALLGLRRRD